MAKLSGYEFLNSTLVLMNYLLLVVVIFLELAMGAGLIELLATEGRTVEKVAKMAIVVETTTL
jgi:hypothetical protein